MHYFNYTLRLFINSYCDLNFPTGKLIFVFLVKLNDIIINYMVFQTTQGLILPDCTRVKEKTSANNICVANYFSPLLALKKFFTDSVRLHCILLFILI